MRERGGLPLFPVTSVGSWPRPTWLLRALDDRQRGDLGDDAFDGVADKAVLECLTAQVAAGVDLVTDGEQRRDNFYSFVADNLSGVRLMTLAELLDVVDDKESFEALLATMDVPAFSISTPACVGPVARRAPLAARELGFLRQHTERPIKIALPGPYLLTRAMWVRELSRDYYPTVADLAEVVVGILSDEIRELEAIGVDFIQLDEPVLTELVFAQGSTRTFMCAALAAREDPAEELDFAVGLLNRVLGSVRGTRTGLHVCRGNWSRDESTLLSGSFHPLQAYFDRIQVRQLVLEYATPRAGTLVPVGDKELGLGVVNPRSSEVEPPEAVLAQVRRALTVVPAHRIFLNPDCGFGTFARRPMNTPEVATAKLRSMVVAARRLRDTEERQ